MTLPDVPVQFAALVTKLGAASDQFEILK